MTALCSNCLAEYKMKKKSMQKNKQIQKKCNGKEKQEVIHSWNQTSMIHPQATGRRERQ